MIHSFFIGLIIHVNIYSNCHMPPSKWQISALYTKISTLTKVQSIDAMVWFGTAQSQIPNGSCNQ